MENFLKFAKNVWPSINRFINNLFSFLLRTIKSAVDIAINQIKP